MVVFLADRRAVAFLAAGLRAAEVFFRAVVLRDVVFLRVVDLRAVDLRAPDVRFRVVAAFFAARDLTVALRFRVAAAFLAAADRFLEVVFLRAGGIPHLLSSRQDAMRFRRRLSRSLMPPHTPYRSSRRSA